MDHRFDKSGWVYFVGAEILGLIKIGFTASHPDRRFVTLQKSSPDAILKLGVMAGTLATERLLHRRFRLPPRPVRPPRHPALWLHVTTSA